MKQGTHLWTAVALAAAMTACSDPYQTPAADRGPDVRAGDGPAVDSGEPDKKVPMPDSKATQDGKPGPDGKPAADSKPAMDLPQSKGPLRVMTLNLHCLMESPAVRAKGIAQEIKTFNPDAVGLQEICQTTTSGGADNFAKTVAAEIKALTGQAWEFKFAKTHLSWNTYDEGVGLLYRQGQLVASGEQSLPQGSGPFPRKVVWGKLSTSRGAFYLYSTHLTISSNASDRTAQAQAICTLAGAHVSDGLPQVVVGDFNDYYGSGAVSAIKSCQGGFTEAWGTLHPGSANPGLTCCSPNFGSRIDFILIRTATLQSLSKVELVGTSPYQGVALSDHRGVFAEFLTK